MRPGPLLLLAAGLTAACSSSGEPHGSPVLLSVQWISGGGRTQVWTPSEAGMVQAPAAGQRVDFVFDRLLDGNRIEGVVTQNGVQTTVPKATPPITTAWPDAATVMSTPPFSDQVRYNSEPFYGPATAYVLLQPAVVGFPSSDTITFSLDKTNLTSAYGEQMIGPSEIAVTTGPFSASFRLPGGSASVPPNFSLPAIFSNRLASAASVEPFVHVEANGLPVPVMLAADASDLTIVYLSPASCLGGWPVGVPIDVTIAAGVPDAFGVAMAADAHQSFMASGLAPVAPDGGCPVTATDGGADWSDAIFSRSGARTLRRRCRGRRL
jgi:hypothetical protein